MEATRTLDVRTERHNLRPGEDWVAGDMPRSYSTSNVQEQPSMSGLLPRIDRELTNSSRGRDYPDDNAGQSRARRRGNAFRASSEKGHPTQRPPARNELSCCDPARRIAPDWVAAAARARLVSVVAGRMIVVSDGCGWYVGRRDVGGGCCPGAQQRRRNAGDHGCLAATAAKASAMPDIAAHEMSPVCARVCVTDL
jgi:hypothetical protein